MHPAFRLPINFDPVALQRDLDAITGNGWVAHFNTPYYKGDWSGIPLRSVGGEPNRLYPDPVAQTPYADTPLLAHCPAFQHVLARLPFPHLAVRLLRLTPDSSIREHKDYNLGFEDGEIRLHIPIYTNPDVEFRLAGEQIVMLPGECWYLDFNLPHSVANRGTTDRIHLVVDGVVNDWVGELFNLPSHQS
ncbi:MAG: aspartyl/asparaginyl beta-hydroxylase domain-containing protein [Oscillochloris sp.]|nr:aspartyl/asparaginyl beta-hydroxylase domain-containing protein [Oscillochloris sp.]